VIVPDETTTAPRRTRARRGEGPLLRERILDAAERLLIQTGDEDQVSIRAVADEVGVTPPSIYMHFADKRELIFAVCDKHYERFDEFVERAAAGIEDPLASLHARGRAYVQFGLENPEHYRVLFMGKPSATPASYDPQQILTSSAFAHLIEAVHRCADAGVIRGETLMVSISLWAGVHGITSLLISKPNFPWPYREELIDRVLWNLVEGVLAR
jgi:AcrR family transcriptional regulator